MGVITTMLPTQLGLLSTEITPEILVIILPNLKLRKWKPGS